jgi:hypothetical protein
LTIGGKDKENLFGQMARKSKVNGFMVKGMVMVSKDLLMGMFTKVFKDQTNIL